MLPGFGLISLRIIRRNKMRLDFLTDLDRMQESFLNYSRKAEQTPEKSIEIATEDFQRIAEVEKVQIARQRADALERFRREMKAPAYTLLKSTAFLKEEDELSPAQRAIVEKHIEKLISEPKPEGSKKDTDSGMWQSRVPESSFEILYTIDDRFRQVSIIAVQDTSAKGEPMASKPGGKSNA